VCQRLRLNSRQIAREITGTALKLSTFAHAVGIGIAFGAVSTMAAQPLSVRSSLNITAYGAANSTNVGSALQNALNDCAALGLPVYVPAGYYQVTATASWPTNNNNCPGIYGDGPSSVFQPVNFNGPVISAVVQPGVPQTNKVIRDLTVMPQWTSVSDAHDQSRLISITGSQEGWAYSRFERLRGIGSKDIVLIGTATAIVGPYIQSNSGWNVFDGLFIQGGSQGITPDYAISFSNSTSTGNLVSNMMGAPADSFVYVGGGIDLVGRLFDIGDVVINGGQLGGGRVLHVAGPTCASYLRSMTVINVQVDAGSKEVIAVDCGTANNLKLSGTFGGSAPWSGIKYLSLSEIHDLGESHWGAGGPISSPGRPGSHSVALWTMDLRQNTMSRVEVSMSGTWGGLGGGGAIYVFDVARGIGNASVKEVPSLRSQLAPDSRGQVPSGWPAVSASVSGGTVSFTGNWIDNEPTSNATTSINIHHGAFKLNRGPTVSY
jgi:hypothetical protein